MCGGGLGGVWCFVQGDTQHIASLVKSLSSIFRGLVMMFFKKYSVIICGLFLSACSEYPVTDGEVVQHYYDNADTYQSLAEQSCLIPRQENKDFLVISINETNSEYSDIQSTLRALGRDSISISNVRGECSLEVIYDAFGLGGSATVYSLKFNVVEPIPYNKIVHAFKKRKDTKDDINFDMKLSNGWYFSFSQN